MWLINVEKIPLSVFVNINAHDENKLTHMFVNEFLLVGILGLSAKGLEFIPVLSKMVATRHSGYWTLEM